MQETHRDLLTAMASSDSYDSEKIHVVLFLVEKNSSFSQCIRVQRAKLHHLFSHHAKQTDKSLLTAMVLY